MREKSGSATFIFGPLTLSPGASERKKKRRSGPVPCQNTRRNRSWQTTSANTPASSRSRVIRSRRSLNFGRPSGRPVIGDSESAWVTALVLCTLKTTNDLALPRERAFRWLMMERGREGNWFWPWKFRIADREVRFDPDKYGWPWSSATIQAVYQPRMALHGRMGRCGQSLERGCQFPFGKISAFANPTRWRCLCICQRSIGTLCVRSMKGSPGQTAYLSWPECTLLTALDSVGD